MSCTLSLYLCFFFCESATDTGRRRDEKQFPRFVNMVLNDAIFLWDETMTKLAEIHRNQVEIERGAWNALDPVPACRKIYNSRDDLQS
jgi:hypothetical protein